MDISPTILDRINAAADALYAAAGRQTFPTVDAVRKQAKVNMNDASVGMRTWRRAHSAESPTPAAEIPEGLQAASVDALHSLWAEAVAQSSETLRAARAGWEADRAEAEVLSEQMANAYDAQARELAAAQMEIVRLTSENGRLGEALAASQLLADDARRQGDEAKAAAAQAVFSAENSERRAEELRQGLDRVQVLLTGMQDASTSLRRSHEEDSSRLRAELLETRQKAERDQVTATKELRTAIEEAAALKGKLSAIIEANPIATGQSRPRRRDDGGVGVHRTDAGVTEEDGTEADGKPAANDGRKAPPVARPRARNRPDGKEPNSKQR